MFWFVPALICTFGVMLPAVDSRYSEDAGFVLICAFLCYTPYLNWALALYVSAAWCKENF